MDIHCICGGKADFDYQEDDVVEPYLSRVGSELLYHWPGADCNGCGREAMTDEHVVALTQSAIGDVIRDANAYQLLSSHGALPYLQAQGYQRQDRKRRSVASRFAAVLMVLNMILLPGNGSGLASERPATRWRREP